MHKTYLGLLAATLWVCAVTAQDGTDTAPDKRKSNVPEGYALVCEQSFDSRDALAEFEFSTPTQWKWSALTEGGCLEFGQKSKYSPKVRSPRTIALLASRSFGSFVLEADLLQTGKEYGHRDMCLFFGFTDPSKFYYTHIATRTDKHAHNIFIVNDKPRTRISEKTTKGVKWGRDVWHHVRLERNVDTGTIRVFFDDLTTPIMTATDTTFKQGLIGFGSFDDSGRVDNVKIWAPSETTTESAFFGRAP